MLSARWTYSDENDFFLHSLNVKIIAYSCVFAYIIIIFCQSRELHLSARLELDSFKAPAMNSSLLWWPAITCFQYNFQWYWLVSHTILRGSRFPFLTHVLCGMRTIIFMPFHGCLFTIFLAHCCAHCDSRTLYLFMIFELGAFDMKSCKHFVLRTFIA